MSIFDKKKVVVIGGGAAGVFTAYLLKKNADFLFDVKLLEAQSRLGGHTISNSISDSIVTVNVDTGAQFFSETVQPEYWDLLKNEGFFDNPGDPLIEKPADVTIWNDTTGTLLFRVPNTIQGVVDSVDQNPLDWLNFLILSLAAIAHYRFGDWNLPFGTWLNSIPFLLTNAEKAKFKENIARPLLYQFGLIDPPLLDDLSAKFVVYYYVGSLPWKGGKAPFSVYNSLIGLDGILDALRKNHGLDVQLNTEVTSIARQGDGYVVTANGSTFDADEIVFATNPPWTRALLPPDSDFDAVRTVLDAMPYVTVPVNLQVTDNPEYMPGLNKDDWSVSNVLKVEDSGGNPTHYMLSVWFGKLRDEALGAKCFKSWGSPALEPLPTNPPAQVHRLMVGTPTFIERRQTLRTVHQGEHHLWYTGGYILDYDCQNACLKSAARVSSQLIHKRLLEMIAAATQWFIQPLQAELPDVSDHLPSPEFSIDPRDRPRVLRVIENRLRQEHSEHPAVARWIEENPEPVPST